MGLEQDWSQESCQEPAVFQTETVLDATEGELRRGLEGSGRIQEI